MGRGCPRMITRISHQPRPGPPPGGPPLSEASARGPVYAWRPRRLPGRRHEPAHQKRHRTDGGRRGLRDRGRRGLRRGRTHRRGGSERRGRGGARRGRRARRRRPRQGRAARLRQHPQPRRLYLLPWTRRGHGARLRDRPVLPDGHGREPRGAPRGRLAHLRGAPEERGDHHAGDGGGGRRLRSLRRIARGAQLHGRDDLRRRRRCDGQGRVPLRRSAARGPASPGGGLRGALARQGGRTHPGDDDPEHDHLLLPGAAAREPRDRGPDGLAHQHSPRVGRVRDGGDAAPAGPELVRVRARFGGTGRGYGLRALLRRRRSGRGRARRVEGRRRTLPADERGARAHRAGGRVPLPRHPGLARHRQHVRGSLRGAAGRA